MKVVVIDYRHCLVREMATETGAHALLASCDDYETRNAEFILRYRQAMEENM